ncbi:MAG TPA: cytochrome P460 family protein [Kofleriaceae bacterium]|nr:cytochrome P460 family protein [Kofleriaceae bacterium]
MFVFAIGCSSDDPGSIPSDDQTPPTSGSAVESWLADGAYRTWAAEAQIHEARSPSPHGFNRIYSNELVAQNATGTGSWPKGAAAVKELYASATDPTPIGYAVYLKLDADSANGANWYWYERMGQMVFADGRGNEGTAKSLCVGCHAAAGADPAHTPSPGGRDQVYTPVGG